MWDIALTKKAQKQLAQLPWLVENAFTELAEDLEAFGPIQPHWSHFGRLKGKARNQFHCHIKDGRTTYVACWEEIEGRIEVYFIGTHETAPY
jgi:mRNA-degrading endonuclease RelE of RelBE toxin-antitoxin system